MSPKHTPYFDLVSFLAAEGGGRTLAEYRKDQVVFLQGDRAEDVFYIHSGTVKVTVNSVRGKEAVIAFLGPGNYFGEGCLAGQTIRKSTATATSECVIGRIAKCTMTRLLREETAFAETFVAFLLSRNTRIEEDLVDQLVHSSEKRLARMLLVLANFDSQGPPERVIPRISQETLAEMVGTTRSRVSFFMNKFRRLGFIEYNGEIKVRSSLLSAILED
jgi:CRP/FNR family transcriptional regulator, cyclic AMP receptor protein